MKTDETILILLRENRLRLTKTRKALMELFLCNKPPLSVPEILSLLKKMRLGVNKTTVYRELERLQQAEIIAVVQLGGRKRHYELASRKHHHHLICVKCEHVEDVDVDEDDFLREKYKAIQERHFAVLRHSLEFFGLCKMCS